jgi:hypothetical protein
VASFTHHQRIAADSTKSRGSLFTAKGAGNLLLKHPEVVFSEIVGKRPSMSEAGIARKVRLLTGQINAQRFKLVSIHIPIGGTTGLLLKQAIKESFVAGFRAATLTGAGLALGAALSSLLLIEGKKPNK